MTGVGTIRGGRWGAGGGTGTGGGLWGGQEVRRSKPQVTKSGDIKKGQRGGDGRVGGDGIRAVS